MSTHYIVLVLYVRKESLVRNKGLVQREYGRKRTKRKEYGIFIGFFLIEIGITKESI